MTPPQKIILEHLRYIRLQLDSIAGIIKSHDRRFDLIEHQLAGARAEMGITLELAGVQPAEN